ncbi:MAG: calcium-binding protein [Sedimentitalea sp.]|uniref:calcium-binding protein n=1 Tax=Sedimentitalea sp. TaxID=2048915 RepID=UPI003265AEC1
MLVFYGTENDDNPTMGTLPLNGTNKSDKLFGLGGNDLLLGYNGKDILVGGAGADILDGGGGRNTASYEDATTSVTADLSDSSKNLGDAAGDTYISIRDLIGSAQDDVLFGDNRMNTLVGGAGNDTLFGGHGDDVLVGGRDADILDGGNGHDTTSYEFSHQAVFVDLRLGIAFGGDAQGDRLISIENITGSDHSDALYGSAEDERLYGRQGDDQVFGRSGDDFLDGGYGGDFLRGGQGNDTIDGSLGSDRIAGNAGDDILFGGYGRDRDFIHGGAGQDVIMLGGDRISGGADADVFVFRFSLGRDVITDFEDGIDLIDLPSSYSMADVVIRQGGNGHTMIHIGTSSHLDPDIIILKNINASVIDVADFTFDGGPATAKAVSAADGEGDWISL